MRELDRLKCIQAVIDGDLKPGRAAERLGLTVRQIERLVVRYRSEGPIGLISRHRNRPGNRGLKAPLVDHVLSILREHYADFGPALAAEKLKSRHKIILAKQRAGARGLRGDAVAVARVRNFRSSIKHLKQGLEGL
jgi:hypothetical protein